MRSLILAAAIFAAAPAYADESEHCEQAVMMEALMASVLKALGGVMNDPTQPEADRDEATFKVIETTQKLENLSAWISENCQPSNSTSNATSAR